MFKLSPIEVYIYPISVINTTFSAVRCDATRGDMSC